MGAAPGPEEHECYEVPCLAQTSSQAQGAGAAHAW